LIVSLSLELKRKHFHSYV